MTFWKKIDLLVTSSGTSFSGSQKGVGTPYDEARCLAIAAELRISAR